MRLHLLFVPSLLFLAACATTPKGPSFAQPSPQDKEAASLYIYRNHTPPILRKPDVLVNGTMVGELPTDSYMVLHLKPGAYEVKTDWGIDGLTLNRTTQVSVVAGSAHYVEVGL